jgi:maltose alpha-D-glucosyltransferase/alpha-amylase
MRHLERTLAALLPSYLPRQRWFGGKARTIVACDVDDVVDLDAEGEAALIVAGVSYHDERRERYGLLVARSPDDREGRALGQLTPPGDGWIVEGAHDARPCRALLAGFADGREIASRAGGAVRYDDATEAARRILGRPDVGLAPVGAEQSNTSLRIERAFIFKLFRRLEAGENPELEVGRFLATRTRFRATAPLEGSVLYRPPHGDEVTIGVLQGWVESRSDGWAYIVGQLNEGIRTGRVPAPLVEDLALLGRITADFHAALGSDDRSEAFRPVPVAAADVEAWAAAVRHSAGRVFGTIAERLPSWDDDLRRLGEEVIARAARVEDIVPDDMPASPFSKIRIHGDYHLGQTLKTADGFVIIDFEGEPAIPIPRRRQKHCALKDVAGMLRSFDYAVESACEGRPDDAGRVRSMVDLRAPFLRAYVDAATRQSNVSVPADQGVLMRWLALFEFEKALYEFEYEINNRPAWVHIPLRGILQAMSG